MNFKKVGQAILAEAEVDLQAMEIELEKLKRLRANWLNKIEREYTKRIDQLENQIKAIKKIGKKP